MAGTGADGTVHVVGAGIAGLACAVRLVRHGLAVRLYEDFVLTDASWAATLLALQ